MKLSKGELDSAIYYFQNALGVKIESVQEIKMRSGGSQYVLFAGLNLNEESRRIHIVEDSAFLLGFQISEEKQNSITQGYTQLVNFNKNKITLKI